jgi:hypothetical protein
MAMVEARKGRLGFAFNPLFVRTNSDARTGRLDAKNKIDIATAGAVDPQAMLGLRPTHTSICDPENSPGSV